MHAGEKSLDCLLGEATIANACTAVEQYFTLKNLDLPREVIRPAEKAYTALCAAGIKDTTALRYIAGHLERLAERERSAPYQQVMMDGICEFAMASAPERVRAVVGASFPEKLNVAPAKPAKSGERVAPPPQVYDTNSTRFKHGVQMFNDGVDPMLVKYFLDLPEPQETPGERYLFLSEIMPSAPSNTVASVLKELYEGKPLSNEALLWLADPVPSSAPATYTLPRWIARRVKETLAPQPWASRPFSAQMHYPV